VRRVLLSTGAGLAFCLTLVAGFSLAQASEIGVTDPRTGTTPPPVTKPAVKPIKPVKVDAKEEGECGNHGTSVNFVDTPRQAAEQAKKEQKLVFVLHISGVFEDPNLT